LKISPVQTDVVRVGKCDDAAVSASVRVGDDNDRDAFELDALGLWEGLGVNPWVPHISFVSEAAAGGGESETSPWYPICAQGFADNDHGATAVCRQMGYSRGHCTYT
jgi:hypothetical protein